MRDFIIILSIIMLTSCSFFAKEKIVYVEVPVQVANKCGNLVKEPVLDNKKYDDIALVLSALGQNIDKLIKYYKDLKEQIKCYEESTKIIDKKK